MNRHDHIINRRVNKRGNIIATALIVIVLLLSAAIMLQREVYTKDSSDLHTIMSDFAQHVYRTPEELLNRYAMNGYQNDTQPYWFCGNIATPPNLNRTKDDFGSFSKGDLVSRLNDLTQQYPKLNISISSPNFVLVADDLITRIPNDTAEVNITGVTITIRDGERTIMRSLDQDSVYRMRFWYMNKALINWISCDSGGIYSAVQSAFYARKSCAFYKGTCICAEGEKLCNGPSMDKENENDPKKHQDFTKIERDTLMNEYGVTPSDIQAAADTLAQELTLAFNGSSSCNGKNLSEKPTGIVCTARIEDPKVYNNFYSSYVFHNTGCVWQVGPLCGIVSISEFDSLACIQKLGDVLKNPSLKDVMMTVANTGTLPRGCVPWSEGGMNYIKCGKNVFSTGSGQLIPDTNAACKEQLSRSTNGRAGPWAEFSEDIKCNPAPESITKTTSVQDTDFGGSTKIKKLSDPADYNPRDGVWYGTNGWIDRKGSTDIIVTCSDPGQGTSPLQAEVRLHVVFRYLCDSTQQRMMGYAQGCAAGGVEDDPDCPLDCQTSNPCIQKSCRPKASGTGKECVVTKKLNSYFKSTDPCNIYKCGGTDEDWGPTDTIETKNIGAGCKYNGGDESCGTCQDDGDKATCTAKQSTSCTPNRGASACQKYICEDGTCTHDTTQDDDPTLTCQGGECGTCNCVGGYPKLEENTNFDCGSTTQYVSCGVQEPVPNECIKSNGVYVCKSTKQPFDTSKCCGNNNCPSGCCALFDNTICSNDPQCTGTGGG